MAATTNGGDGDVPTLTDLDDTVAAMGLDRLIADLRRCRGGRTRCIRTRGHGGRCAPPDRLTVVDGDWESFASATGLVCQVCDDAYYASTEGMDLCMYHYDQIER